MTIRRILWAARRRLAPLLAVAACVSEGKTAGQAEPLLPPPAMLDPEQRETPATGAWTTYRCDDRFGSRALEKHGNRGQGHLGPDGETLDLPAAPPGQFSRYGKTI